MILRDARPEERRALEELQRRASLMWEDARAYLLANPDVIELPLAHIAAGRVRVAEEADHVLGFAVLLPRGPGVSELEGLFVEPQCWGRGIGRALVADAMARTADSRLEVVSNPQAEGFYVRQGFTVCGAAQTPFGPAQRLAITRKLG